MGVVDDSNRKHGITYQDVAARKILTHPYTDDVVLFDFNYSGHRFKHMYNAKGIAFTIYEIITRDTYFRDVPPNRQNPADVEEWPQTFGHG